MIQQSHSWAYIQKKPKTLIWKDTCISIFIAALLIIVNIWKQPKSPLTDKWIKKITHRHIHTHPYNGLLACPKKEWNHAICSTMGGGRDYHSKWNKSDKDKIPYDIIYI